MEEAGENVNEKNGRRRRSRSRYSSERDASGDVEKNGRRMGQHGTGMKNRSSVSNEHNNTVTLTCVQNKTKKILEQKRKALLELEDQRRQRDEEMKREAQEAKNKVIEKARRLKFEERDSVKMFNRALQLSEVIDNNVMH